MNLEEFRTVLKAEPFTPFTMHLADGRQLPVKHPDFVAIAPSGRAAIVYQPDNSFNVVDLLLVTDLEVGGNGRAHGARRRRRK
jgi:hypothetical protein